MSFPVLDYAKTKLLAGDFNMAASYYNRAGSEGIPACIVNLRYLTKEYLAYPLEFENSTYYFDLLKELGKIVRKDPAYEAEYKLALRSLVDIKKLFLRSLSLYYYSDILVSSADSVVLKEIGQLLRYIRENKADILEADIYGLQKYIPKFNSKTLTRDLDVVEAYCMNILLSYTAEQHSVYMGKRYSALTVDYGYFYSTTVRESDRYYNFANVKPRMFLLGYEAYYHELRRMYEEKRRQTGDFASPSELRKELTAYVNHKVKKHSTDAEFIQYAKAFGKQDSARESLIGTLSNVSKTVNPLLKLNPMEALWANNVGSFELDEYFPQKKFLGVCSMLAAGKGWKVDTVRYIMLIFCCFAGIGVVAYIAMAIAKKMGFYFGVNVQKP